MFPGATLLLDVCVQCDFWPGGAWPLVSGEVADQVARLLATVSPDVRRGGIVCGHDAASGPVVPGVPDHCATAESRARPPGLPPREASAIYLESGCGESPRSADYEGSFRRLAAGIRDAVVFGAGLEHGVSQAIEALLDRHVRTHLVIDAVAAASDVEAQILVGRWKRRGVDVVTVGGVERLLALR